MSSNRDICPVHGPFVNPPPYSPWGDQDPRAWLSGLSSNDPALMQQALLRMQMLGTMQLVMLLQSLDAAMLQLVAQLVSAAVSSGNGRPGGPQQDSFTRMGGTEKPDLGPTTPGSVQDKLFKAVILQESGGNYRAVNRHSGALGIGQVMPANVKSWSKEALGYSITPQQFLNSPELQKKIIEFKLDQYYREALRKGYSPADAVRFVAAKWYSGKGERMNSTKPQNGYPSIRAYTMSVLANFNKA